MRSLKETNIEFLSTCKRFAGTNGGLDIYTMSAPKGKETTNDGLTFEKSLESDLVFKVGVVY